jgi:L-lactate permease
MSSRILRVGIPVILVLAAAGIVLLALGQRVGIALLLGSFFITPLTAVFAVLDFPHDEPRR